MYSSTDDSAQGLLCPRLCLRAGVATGTRAAALGGITTVIEMPLNSQPTTILPENLKEKQTIAKVRPIAHPKLPLHLPSPTHSLTHYIAHAFRNTCRFHKRYFHNF